MLNNSDAPTHSRSAGQRVGPETGNLGSLDVFYRTSVKLG